MKPPKIGNDLVSRSKATRPDPAGQVPRVLSDTGAGDEHPLYTGRHFLIQREAESNERETKKILASKWGLTVAETADFSTEGLNEEDLHGADALIYNELGITLLGVEDEPAHLLQSFDSDYFIAPEKVVYVPDDIPAQPGQPSTWGVQACGVIDSRYTGSGIRVAVLDTGFDTGHPDFIGREISTSSFVPNEPIQDRHGHGTHCIGVACGSSGENGLRYGVAPHAHIFAGKVLSDGGSGAQSWVLNGITWAAKNGCKVISLSLGTPVFPGQAYDIAYERAARFARSNGAALVAAAGNQSDRSRDRHSPVASPADCPSILAVAALDESLSIANFSNREINPSGKVDIAGPGVDIHSAWPMPQRYRTLSGTSMATPHVAGILALLFEKYPHATPMEIEQELARLAKHLPIAAKDAGAGLCIAP